MSGINQKEYLKKYLGMGKGSGEKKKKKKSKKISNGLKIVDDDVDIRLDQEIQEDLTADNEEAPQIVSVIDDRPPSLRIDEQTHNNLWKPIGSLNVSSNSSPRKVNIERSEDNSLPRKFRSREDNSSRTESGDLHNSHTKIIKRERSKDISPPRKVRAKKDFSSSMDRIDNINSSSPRLVKREKSEDISPLRRRKESSKTQRRSRWSNWEDSGDKMKKTLDGKKAGLQNATDLLLETSELKTKENEWFQNMSADVSGANAATVVRGKKKEIDWDEEEKIRKKELENKEKYNRWGKGLKQVEDASEKARNELYEMSKPVARYADDEDLEKYLKDQERAGDPMLAYIRQKKKKKMGGESKPVIQQYEGDAPPNRFGIRPGYRWDGVNRSNGYEKQWFEVQNSRKASLDESYKWSTEDM